MICVICVVSRHLGKTVWLCRSREPCPNEPPLARERERGSVFCWRQRLISPLFYQDDQICNFPAPLSCLGEDGGGKWVIVSGNAGRLFGEMRFVGAASSYLCARLRLPFKWGTLATRGFPRIEGRVVVPVRYGRMILLRRPFKPTIPRMALAHKNL